MFCLFEAIFLLAAFPPNCTKSLILT